MNLINCIKVWKNHGTVRYIRMLYLHFLIYHWTSRRDYLISLRKGSCNHCGKCCTYRHTGKKCEYLDKCNKCTAYDHREYLIDKEVCIYAPLPLHFKLNPKKWGNCGFYYKFGGK